MRIPSSLDKVKDKFSFFHIPLTTEHREQTFLMRIAIGDDDTSVVL